MLNHLLRSKELLSFCRVSVRDQSDGITKRERPACRGIDTKLSMHAADHQIGYGVRLQSGLKFRAQKGIWRGLSDAQF